MYVVRVDCILARPILCRTIRLWWRDNNILQITGQMKLAADSSSGHCVGLSLPTHWIIIANCKYGPKGFMYKSNQSLGVRSGDAELPVASMSCSACDRRRL